MEVEERGRRQSGVKVAVLKRGGGVRGGSQGMREEVTDVQKDEGKVAEREDKFCEDRRTRWQEKVKDKEKGRLRR